MSEQPTVPALVIGDDPAASMAAIMDFLLDEKDPAPAGEGAAADGAAAAVPGQQPAAGEGAGAAAEPAAAPAVGDGGQPPVPQPGAEQPPAPAGDDGERLPAAAGADPDLIVTQLGDLPAAFDERQRQGLEQEQLAKLVEERPALFQMLQQHPRELIGQDLPALTGTGTERIKDSADAASYQDAWRERVLRELSERVETGQTELREVSQTVHASAKFFQDNKDLIPGAKGFDRELADAFADAVKDYVVRSNEKAIGWSVPVQPIVNALRSQIAARRATVVQQPPAAASPSPRQQQAADQPRTPTGQFDAPQAGLRSQAGQSTGGEMSDAEGLIAAFSRQNGIPL